MARIDELSQPQGAPLAFRHEPLFPRLKCMRTSVVPERVRREMLAQSATPDHCLHFPHHRTQRARSGLQQFRACLRKFNAVQWRSPQYNAVR